VAVTIREAIRRSLGLLTSRDRKLLAISTILQMATSLLDLLGVILIGLTGALAVTTVQSQPAPTAVTQVADALGLTDVPDQNLVALFAGAAAVILLSKSMLSSYMTRRVFRFLANRQALVSARLTQALLSRPLTFIQKRSSQETAFALIGGAAAATTQILGQAVVILTELAVLLVLAVALLFLSPWMAIGSIVFFSMVALALQRAMGGWAARVGSASARADIASLNSVQEVLGTYRETTVSNRRSHYVARIQAQRWEAARVAADAQFIGMFPKYMFEAALVLGGFALAAVLFLTQDSVAAAGTLALFVAAGTRVMPSLLRLQTASLTLRSSAGLATPTFELAEELGNPSGDPSSFTASTLVRERIRTGNPDFTPSVDLKEVSVWYPGAPSPALDGISLEVNPGESLALVGPSGAGKSTLADVILGVLDPDSGRALINDVSPSTCTETWPGAVAYVPQHVVLANDSIRGNVCLGLPSESIDDDLVWRALEQAHLTATVQALGDGLDAMVGENGVRLSGGQRQRLGIARALYTSPKLLVMDEATSALDAETEHAITEMLRDMGKDVTTIVVAHRLSTVRSVDRLMYLDRGQCVASGTFEEVASSVPAFERQAALMGLA
jgi:ABC-type multidrug transport system fused ATPase/permease subunit